MTEMHMVQALNSAMDNMMKEDKSVIILGGDVGVDGAGQIRCNRECETSGVDGEYLLAAVGEGGLDEEFK